MSTSAYPALIVKGFPRPDEEGRDIPIEETIKKSLKVHFGKKKHGRAKVRAIMILSEEVARVEFENDEGECQLSDNTDNILMK